nr:hypothetical protein GCM10010200_067020 [Actinomadura rugatobispora]
MQGGQHVPAGQGVLGADLGGVEGVQVLQQGVDHRVAHEVRPLDADALCGQVADRLGAGDQAQVRQLVGQAPVDLLGHGHVEAAQAGLHMRDRDVQLGRDQRGGDRRVHVAVHHDQVRRAAQELPFEARHECGRLRGVAPRPHAEVHVRLGQPQLAEEDLRHPLVVVLAGVDDRLPDPSGPQRLDDRSRLDEVGTRAEHMQDDHEGSVPDRGGIQGAAGQ